jgi:glycosyltransferase involved in cell wall biosynthesis
MRIRFISSTPMNVFQGSGTYVGIETLARSLRALGVQVDIVTPHLRFPIYTVQRLLFNQSLRLRRQNDYDVTVGFDMDGYTLAGHTSARQTSLGAGPKVHVAAIKGVIADEMRFESGMTKMTMRLQAACEAEHARRADFVMTTSAYAAGQIQQLYGVSQPPRIVPEPIDLAAWEAMARNNAPPPAGKFIVLTVCRFYPRKRVPVLLAAADRLRSRIPGLEVRIVGGGPEEDRLRSICRERNLQEVVVWRRNISGAELAREYSQCHLFCLPSVQEGFGIVFLEAMANGKPVVAARAGATPEVVQHGLLVEPDNDQELADAIERLYREPLLRESLGNAGRSFVRRFDAPVVGRMFLRELEDFVRLKAEAFPRELEGGSVATRTKR